MSRRVLRAEPRATARRGGLAGISRGWRTAGVSVAAVGLLAAFVLTDPGVPVQEVDLNDGSVWISSTTARSVGRYNPAFHELSGGVISFSEAPDVVQDGQDVLLLEPDLGAVSVIDPATVAAATQVAVPPGALADARAGTALVLDRADGRAWVVPFGALPSLTLATTPPVAEVAPGATGAVTLEGTVLLAGGDGAVSRVALEDDLAAVDGEVGGSGRLGAGQALSANLAAHVADAGWDQVAAVGEELVALAGSTLAGPGWYADLSGYGTPLALQQTGPDARTVLVAGPTSIAEVDLESGTVSERPDPGAAEDATPQGAPARPVLVEGCVHAAWSSPRASYRMECTGAQPVLHDLDGMSDQAKLVFRVNRDVVVLNDVRAGNVWVPDDMPTMHEPDWDAVMQEDEDEADTESEQDRVNDVTRRPECTAESATPLAVADDYGVRAGRTRILSVIDNDVSSDCGFLTIESVEPIPAEFGTVVPVHEGRALQVLVAPDASGSVTFDYTVSDKRPGVAGSVAQVTLTVRDESTNGAPTQVRKSTLTVEAGGAATHDVLADFADPDGDDLILVGARSDKGQLQTRADGRLTYRSDDADLGRRTVRVIVADGAGEDAEQVEGTLTVEVRPAGSVPPTIDPLVVRTTVDQPVELSPLDVVRSSSREPVRLVGVDEVAGTTIERHTDEGTFTVTSSVAGTYYVPFTVAAGTQQAVGLARVDVLPRPEEGGPPLAVRDVVMLPPGAEVVIAPLANDTDPLGRILVLQGVEVPDRSPVRAVVLEHQFVRISSDRVLDEPTTLTYTVSNGAQSVQGEIVVHPVPNSGEQRPPVVEDVSVSVRTDGVVTIPVLEGAFDPDGDPIELARELPTTLPENQGLLFVSGNVLRYQAPPEPRTVKAGFTVLDAHGNPTTAQLTITVHTSDPETKRPPRPRNLTARVFDGDTVRITVPLSGIDDDGDGVVLLGQDRAPAKGRIVEVGADFLRYEAFPGEFGTDTFTYAVEDWAGQRAVATVRIGIAPRPVSTSGLVARDDEITIRPGRTAAVRVLANDIATDGSELALSPDLRIDADDAGLLAEVEGDRVVVTAPEKVGRYHVVYTATTARGGRDLATLVVVVDETVEVLPPVARDVVVSALEAVDKSTVRVDVLAVAENPSGPMSDLVVRVPERYATTATVLDDGQVSIALGPTALTVPYQLVNTDPDAGGLGSWAFITVPALGDFPPMLRPRAPVVEVLGGESVDIRLVDHVRVAQGKEPRLVDASSIQTIGTDGSEAYLDASTLRFSASPEFAGPASITFTVTDGSSAEDPAGRQRTLTIPVTVLAAEANPPTFTPSVLEIAQGDAPISVDLTAFTRVPAGQGDASAYTYALSGGDYGAFTVALNGSLLTVSTATSTRRGTTGSVEVRISYSATGSIVGRVDLRTVGSPQPLARLAPVQVDGEAGVSRTLSVLEGSFNPFPDAPLVVTSARVVRGSGTASHTGTALTVTPDADFIGPLEVRYTVLDATRESERMVEGVATVTVRGAPAAPIGVRASDPGDRTVTLSWTAATPNGEPVTAYRVSAVAGGFTQVCGPATSCQLTGLTNDSTYRFTVAAQNQVGWSPESEASSEVRPDVRPETPEAPRLTFGDSSLVARWTAPANTGSPITGYTLQVEGGTTVQVQGNVTNQTIGSLVNGRSYRVRIQATNSAQTPSGWSEWSSSETPAAVPDAPKVEAMRVEDAAGGRIEVKWTRPSDSSGDAVARYEITVSSPSASDTVYRVTAGGELNVKLFTGLTNGVEYTFAVVAINKAGSSSAGRATTKTYAVPAQVSRPTVTGSSPGDGAVAGEGWVRGSWTAPETGGSRITHYEVTVDGTTRKVDGTQLELTGLTGGTAVALTVRACNAAGCGPSSEPRSATPVTKPGLPTGLNLVATNDGDPRNMRLTWAAGHGGGQQASTWVRIVVDGVELVGSRQADGQIDFSVDIRGGGERKVTAYVLGRNASGDTKEVQVDATVTYQVPPNAPGKPNLTLGSGNDSRVITATWSASQESWFNRVDDYSVSWTIDGVAGPGATRSRGDRSVSIDLTEYAGQEVTLVVTVVARNDQGDSPKATSSRTLTIPALPEPDPVPPAGGSDPP